MKHTLRPLLKTKLTLLSSVCLLLGACASGGTGSSMSTDSEQRIDQALARAANSAQSSGESSHSVGILEKLYNRNPKDEGVALRYASALRDAEYYNRALLVLAPFAEKESSSSLVKSEYASVQLALGNYPQAEQYAQKAIIQDETNAQAYQALGIALDSQEKYVEAERSYRKGLDYWKGDPTSIINNLALNLASQDYLEEAVELLEKAKAVSPNRPEVERNLRIIQALLETKQTSHSPRTADKAEAQRKREANAQIPFLNPHAEQQAAASEAPAMEKAVEKPAPKRLKPKAKSQYSGGHKRKS
ncbi:MAG: tetratricopeptide repeat protein [Alphaproteobacteria bacterium]|nr:tetratricopeptide repeat protein [Alphaproteobacteria bacterium]